MDPIITKKIQLTPYAYFNIISKSYFKQSWRLFLLIILIATGIALQTDRNTFGHYVLLWGFCMPLAATAYLWTIAYSNRLNYKSCYYYINQEKLVEFNEDGNQSSIELNYFLEIYQTPHYALAYMSEATYIYLPRNGFETDAAYNKVLQWIRAKINSQHEYIN